MTGRPARPRKIEVDPHAEAVRVLRAADPKLAVWIERVGPCLLPLPGDLDPAVFMRGLVKAIVSQQLSGKAAATIFARVEALVPSLSAADLLATPVEALRAAGLSQNKASFVRDLAERVHTGALDLTALPTMDDEAVIAVLTAVKGVGRWTAQMFLMFHLGRPDVFAVDDLGLRKGLLRVARARKEPDRKRMERMARAWSPHRSVASWYLWRISEIRDDQPQ